MIEKGKENLDMPASAPLDCVVSTNQTSLLIKYCIVVDICDEH